MFCYGHSVPSAQNRLSSNSHVQSRQKVHDARGQPGCGGTVHAAGCASLCCLRGWRRPRVPGDWLSGRALPSHGRGHWFDPSIAHGPAMLGRRPSVVFPAGRSIYPGAEPPDPHDAGLPFRVQLPLRVGREPILPGRCPSGTFPRAAVCTRGSSSWTPSAGLALRVQLPLGTKHDRGNLSHVCSHDRVARVVALCNG